MKYIKETVGQSGDQGCIFCTKPKETADRKNLILFRGKESFIICNAFPYNNGHLMIVPYMHTSNLDDITPQCSQEMWALLAKCRQALTKAFAPHGFNIGMNLGRTAGAGIDQHLHMHIVPRWNGDSNFMPVIGNTKVMSQSLDDAYDALKEFF